MEEQLFPETEYTHRAWEHLYNAVDHPYFQDMDADLIFDALAHQMHFVLFGDYLKRYLYRKMQIRIPLSQVPLSEFQNIIVESFQKNHTPPSFEPTTARLSALARNWLTQKSVKRKVVFLLGFGLRLNVHEVNTFLVNALSEQEINAGDPFEILCSHCFENGYGYDHFLQLKEKYLEGTSDKVIARSFESVPLHEDSESILVRDLAKLRAEEHTLDFQSVAKMEFRKRYEKAKELVANILNQTIDEQANIKIAEYQYRLNNNTRLTEAEKKNRIQVIKQKIKHVAPSEVTEADLEQVICSAIPRDRYGNLTKGDASQLNEQFNGKRFSRQHIIAIFSEKAEVSRFDLITINFFLFSQEPETCSNRKKRYSAFIEDTNHLLKTCHMGGLYVTNPYECFILMCILSDDPLGTYADVWEMSYRES